MSNPKLRFDPYLGAVNSESLKSIARVWGGNYKMRKDECIVAICRGLNDPNQVKAVLATLAPYERTALALAKVMQGIIDAGMLAIGLRASGVSLPKSTSDYDSDSSTLVQPLVRRGLFFSNYDYNPTYLDSYGKAAVFTDERLLAEIPPLKCQPLRLNPVSTPPASTYRRAPVVLLDLMGILQAVENLGGLSLTQSGSIRVNDLRKLAKAMKWKDDPILVDGLPFPEPAIAWVSTFYHANILELSSSQSQRLVLKDPVEQFASRSYAEQIRQLLWGFIEMRDWLEAQFSPWPYPENYTRGRLALTLALTSLPVNAEDFFAIDDLDEALYNRVGDHFSLSSRASYRPSYFNKTPEEKRQAEAERLAKLRQDWLKCERQWLEKALSTWLYYLGLVELGLKDGTPVSFRLTKLGRAVLHPELNISVDAATGKPQPAWIVQPNFEVMVYLEYATSEQLAFLERHAERGSVQQHIALYQLTRESVYRGLESGTSLDELLTQLQAGASVVVPQNVQVELRSWGALREEITLRRRSHLLEFPDQAARQDAIARGVEGVCVGDRFLLLTPQPQVPKRWFCKRIDYSRTLPQCLSVNEEGMIQLITTPDLLLPTQLDRWAERLSDRSWRLTQEKVQAAIKLGARVEELLNLLVTRATHPVPALIEVALIAWTRKLPAVEMAKVMVLRCTEPEVFEALANSEKFKPYWLGKLAPDVLLVDSEQIKALKKQLAWVGLNISDDLIVN
jgi:hypothetical protein